MKILLLDNYDSFTFNLLQLLREAGVDDLHVIKNDQLSLKDAGKYDAFVISPGPGLPVENGITCELIRKYAGERKILGVCLGMQAIAGVFGGKLIQPGDVLHGKTTRVIPEQPLDALFSGMDAGFDAGLYHSWAVDIQTLPDCLHVAAFDERGVIMAIRHNEYDICGVQFHPESIMTPMGGLMVENWLNS